MRNFAANAILNLKEHPPVLYVHGSIMTYRMDDRVIITKANVVRSNQAIMLLVVKVIEGKGPLKATPKAFAFETSDPAVQQYNQVTIQYTAEASFNINVEVFG